jgi:predicted RNase H-like HicB family nuclease
MTSPTQTSDDLFHQAMHAWESAVESGVKMQEEYTKWLRQTCCESGAIKDWYSKTQSAVGETVAKVQGNIDEAVRLVNQQAESSIRLVQKAMEARQTEAAPDAQARLAEWWEAALETARSNTQAVLAANSRMLATWSEMARKVNGEAADTMANLAKKTAEQAEHISRRTTEQVKEMVRQASGNNKI